MELKPSTAIQADSTATKKKIVRKPKTDKTKASANDPVMVELGKGGRLTVKQELFCQALIENSGNASDAYRKAYDAEKMTAKSVNEAASRLLKNSKVSARVDELQADILRRHQVTMDRVIAEYSKLAFANMRRYININSDGMAEVDFSDLTEDQAAAIQEIKVDRLRIVDGDEGQPHGHVERVTFKLADKKGALDSLSKCLGMFIEKHELTGKGGTPLIPVMNVTYG